MLPTPSTRQYSPGPILLKYCRSLNALKWPYLSQILSDTLALATGTRVGTSDHAIACFCIEYGRVLGFVLRYITFCG